MLKSINAWAFQPDRPLPEVFALAKNAGFDAVEVVIAESGPITPETTEAACRRIAEQAQAASVPLSGLASGLGWRYPLTAADPELRRRGLELTAASLRVARWLGIDALLVVPGGVGADFIPGFPITDYDLAYANAAAALQELAPVAEENRVHLAVENVWNKFLLSPLEMRGFLESIDSPWVGSYFDIGNVVLTGYPEQWIRILGSHIRRVHFKDFRRAIGTLDGFCPLLEGDVDWPTVMRALHDIGYDGPVAAEFGGCEPELANIAVAMDTILALSPGKKIE